LFFLIFSVNFICFKCVEMTYGISIALYGAIFKAETIVSFFSGSAINTEGYEIFAVIPRVNYP
jgi:hypothetical protein